MNISFLQKNQLYSILHLNYFHAEVFRVQGTIPKQSIVTDFNNYVTLIEQSASMWDIQEYTKLDTAWKTQGNTLGETNLKKELNWGLNLEIHDDIDKIKGNSRYQIWYKHDTRWQ